MKKIILSACGIIALFATSCKMNVLKGEGKITTATPSVSSFTAVDIDVPIKTEITVKEGAQASIELKGYENILQHIKTKVEGNKLHIYCELGETWRLDENGITAQITVPSLTALSMSGAPDANIHGNVAGAAFKMDLSGAGSVTVDNINVDALQADMSGACDVSIKGGSVKTADYDISGVGNVKAFALQTNQTKIAISGAGDGEVSATEKLIADVSGAGDVKYKGHPAVSQNISGAGSVTSVN